MWTCLTTSGLFVCQFFLLIYIYIGIQHISQYIHNIYDMIWYDMIMIWYDMIWYDMIWYDMIWYDMIWYDIMIWYDMIWYDMIWYDMIWYDMIWYDMIWYDMIWYDILPLLWLVLCTHLFCESNPLFVGWWPLLTCARPSFMPRQGFRFAKFIALLLVGKHSPGAAVVLLKGWTRKICHLIRGKTMIEQWSNG